MAQHDDFADLRRAAQSDQELEAASRLGRAAAQIHHEVLAAGGDEDTARLLSMAFIAALVGNVPMPKPPTIPPLSFHGTDD